MNKPQQNHRLGIDSRDLNICYTGQIFTSPTARLTFALSAQVAHIVVQSIYDDDLETWYVALGVFWPTKFVQIMILG